MKVGFIGCNNMNGAILQGALGSGVLTRESVYIYDISQTVVEKMKPLGVNIAKNNKELCSLTDLILLGTKPHHIKGALEECEGAFEGKALISVAAGITIEQLRELTKKNARVLRVMPNTPAMVGAGVSVFCKETDLLEEEKEEVVAIFQGVGTVEWVEERLINAVAAVSGSGPAYASLFIEAMADGGVKNGLPRDVSYHLASMTLKGTAEMLLKGGLHPGQLKDMVTSPGGTTIEGIEALEKGGLRYAVMDCINKATKKATKLG